MYWEEFGHFNQIEIDLTLIVGKVIKGAVLCGESIWNPKDNEVRER